MLTSYGKFLNDIRTKSFLQIWDEQKYFSTFELVPRDVHNWRGAHAIEMFRPEAVLTLLEIRVLFDVPMTVNDWYWRPNGFQYRGWRPPNYYKDALSTSQHTIFNAFDFDVKKMLATDVILQLAVWKREGKLPYLTGLEKDVSWVHIDCRQSTRLNEDGLFIFSPLE